MPFHRGHSACKALSSCSATVVVATYAANYQLQNTVIIGPAPSTSYSLPEEGVYILYRHRAIQVAGPPCDHRQCNSRQVCCCSGAGHSTSRIPKQPTAESGRTKRTCPDCLVDWQHLYEAAEKSHRNGMVLLAAPRTLTWASPFGYQAFHYDTDLEEDGNLLSYSFPTSSKTSRGRAQHAIDAMSEGWKGFLGRGSYKPHRSIISVPDSGDDSGYDSASGSDWDDFDAPLEEGATTPGSAGGSCGEEEEAEEGFDLIGDIIEEEFPTLNKTLLLARPAAHRPERPRRAPTTGDGDDDEIDEGALAPAIVPPRNMAVAKLLT